MPEPFADIILRTDEREYVSGWRTEPFAPYSYLQQLKDKIRVAKRMRFSDEARKMLADLITDHPREIIAQLDSAKPPFDLIWMENLPNPDHWHEEHMHPLGHLIDDNVCYPISRLKFQGRTALFPSWERVYLNAIWSRSEQDEFFARHNIENWRHWVFGNATNLPAWQDLTDEELRMVLDQTRPTLDGLPDGLKERFENKDGLMNKVISSATMLPLAALIMINTPRVVQEVHIPGYRRFYSGKLRPVREHTEIRLSVSRELVTRYIRDYHGSNQPPQGSGEGGYHLRQHERRGHWAYDYRARTAACVHDWMADDPKHAHCVACGGIRWWRVAYRAGNPALGVLPSRGYLIED